MARTRISITKAQRVCSIMLHQIMGVVDGIRADGELLHSVKIGATICRHVFWFHAVDGKDVCPFVSEGLEHEKGIMLSM